MSGSKRRHVHVVLRQPEGDRELDVALRNPEATLQDVLRAALVDRIPETVAIDGRTVPASTRVHDVGLHEGAVLGLVPGGGPAPPRTGLELVILTGLDAGRALRIRAGRWSIGRDASNAIPLDDETISRTHAALDVDDHGAGTVTDLGSANGTYVDGAEATAAVEIAAGTVVQAGAVAFERPGGAARPRRVGPARGARRPAARARSAPPHRSVRRDRVQPPAAPGECARA